jgi:hypothetical protein
MFCLKTTTQYKLILPYLKWYIYITLIQSLNTCSLHLDFENIIMDPNLFASHILCLNKKKYKNITIHEQIHKTILKTYNILFCYNQHGTNPLW